METVTEDEMDVQACSQAFQYQTKVIYNRLVPNAKEIDDNSVHILQEIKLELTRSVASRELRPAMGLWSDKLTRYIKLYGYKFTKEDHITFVQLIYELIIIPGLEPCLLTRFGQTLVLLLKKKELLSPQDVTVPWRPLYDLCATHFFSNQGGIGLYQYFATLQSTMDAVVHAVKYYFPTSATKEMMDIFRQYLCPFDIMHMATTITAMEWFLPVSLHPSQSAIGYELWLTELMDLWSVCNNDKFWQQDMFWMIARLARHNMGYINWNPYIPMVFSKFIHTLNLPISYKKKENLKYQEIQTAPMALWVVSLLGGNSNVEKHLMQLMKMLECYYHPRNSGKWTNKLGDFLKDLSQYFVKRIHIERYKKPSWETTVHENSRLTDGEITKFVETLKPIILLALYSKITLAAIDAAHNLATLCPSTMVPPIIERFYLLQDCVNEPLKLTATIRSLVAVARPMLEGRWHNYKEGPTHVVPLLLALLPAIDNNDIKKCLAALSLISTLVSMVPLTDCCKASLHYTDLSEEDEIICAATSSFEDFVLQFFNQIFLLIESNSMEHPQLERDSNKRSRLENVIEKNLFTVCHVVLTQTSPTIFEAALRKTNTYVFEHILETEVSAQFLGTICSAFAKVHPEETASSFIPQLCASILSLIENEEILQEERVSNELLYNMLILAEVVDCSGTLPYVPKILSVLNQTLHLKCTKGFMMARDILQNLMKGLSSTVPMDYSSNPDAFHHTLEEYLPILDWGKPGNVDDLKSKWHVPSVEEVTAVQNILSMYLPPEVNRLKEYIESDTETMSRQELHCSLGIVIGILGCKPLLPLWQEPLLEVLDTCSPNTSFNAVYTKSPVSVTMPDGSNVRKTLVEVMDALQKKLLKDTEDDIKSLLNLVKIWDTLIFNNLTLKNTGEMEWQLFDIMKGFQHNRVLGQKRHIRSILIHRLKLHWESLHERSIPYLTWTHQVIISNLMELSVSQYSEVRIRAQGQMNLVLELFLYSYKLIVPRLLEILNLDAIQYHEQLKGALHVVLGSKASLLTVHDWGLLHALWPTLVRIQPSEKLSLIHLLESIEDYVYRHFPTITIRYEVPDNCFAIISKLWETPPLPKGQMLEYKALYNSVDVKEICKTFEEKYILLVNSLLELLESHSLHWRQVSMATVFLRCLIHPDIIFPARGVEYFLESLLSDSLSIRKCAVRAVILLLKQQKRPHQKVVVNPYDMIDEAEASSYKEGIICPGPRPDNQWVHYCSKKKPMNESQWDEPRYVHKQYNGYYAWPSELRLYAPSCDQPPLDRSIDSLSPEELKVYNFFSKQQNVDQLIKFFSLEDKKNTDSFSPFRSLMFKALFRNFGDTYLKFFLQHLQTLVKSEQESSQRCAAEIISGILRGAKHWPFKKVELLWTCLIPVIRTAMSHMTIESIQDWGICFATSMESRDPNRYHWLLELLMEEPLEAAPSFIICGRLYVLQGVLHQQTWRVGELYDRLMNYIRPFLAHSYQNVREKLGSMLVNVFEADIVFPGGQRTQSPHVDEFVDWLLQNMTVLMKMEPESTSCKKDTHFIKEAKSGSIGGLSEHVAEKLSTLSITSVISDNEVAILLLKTASKYILSSVNHSPAGVCIDFYKLLPVLCAMESYEDEELSQCCTQCLVVLSHGKLYAKDIVQALNVIEEVSKSSSWSSRLSCVAFLEVFVFCNIFPLLDIEFTYSKLKILDMVLDLLEDDWMEVRIRASEALSSFFYLGLVPIGILEGFKKKCATPILKTFPGCGREISARYTIAVNERHEGVLGLCAYLDGSPYSIPEHASEILNLLGDHLNDPEPIRTTIRKTVSTFKERHKDVVLNFEEFLDTHKFIFQDIDSPPSYFA